MPLQAGIVGLPNVGKSTLFNALTAAGVDSANYPFTTIDPNVGVVPVPDERLDGLGRLYPDRETIPATVEMVDVAGLVRGASAGEGLGNQFLGHIRNVDAIVHVVRCFTDEDVAHVEGSVDPVRDIETVSLELVLADLEVAERRLESAEREAKSQDREALQHLEMTRRLVEHLRAGNPVREGTWSPAEQALHEELQMLTAKPVLYVCNVDESDLGGESEMADAVRRHAEGTEAGVVMLCAAVEAELAELEPADREEFLAELGLEASGLAVLARATYRLLDLRTFFTIPKEIRAWTVPAGTVAAEAAGVIHSDFQRGFIRAEVYPVEELLEHRSEADLRAEGKIRLEGRDYRVEDGDVIRFYFQT